VDEPTSNGRSSLTGAGRRHSAAIPNSSRMNREVHVRFLEGLGVKFPGPTRRTAAGISATVSLSPGGGGQDRIFQRKGSSFFWIAYHAHGKEHREVARHVRTGEEATEKNHHGAERFLKRRLGDCGRAAWWTPVCWPSARAHHCC